MKIRPLLTRRNFLRTSVGLVGAAAATGFYTWRIEPHWVEVVERSLAIANLPPRLAGARLALLSDLHIGPQVDDAYLIGVFERVRKMAPDIVVYTGDFTSYHPGILSQIAGVFPHLPLGGKGTFAVLGNHDYGHGYQNSAVADGIVDAAAAVGVRVLRNEIAEVDGLQVIGMDDFWAGRFAPQLAFSSLDSTRASLVLSHNPDTADEAGWESYAGWILSGHTHGGQCKPPFLPPPLLPVNNRRYTAGEFALSGGRRMYISRGVGHLLRVRFNTRPEVTIFRLTTV